MSFVGSKRKAVEDSDEDKMEIVEKQQQHDPVAAEKATTDEEAQDTETLPPKKEAKKDEGDDKKATTSTTSSTSSNTGKEATTTAIAQSFSTKDTPAGFPMAITEYGKWGSGEKPWTLAELDIMLISAAIRDKSSWWTKVMDETIVERWKDEILQTLAVREGHNDEINEKKFNYSLAENQWLAQKQQISTTVNNGVSSTGSRPAAVDGVYCLQAISDPALRAKLIQDIAVLRGRPAIGADHEDRHPGTPNMIDLVHPSLYCFEEGKSKVVPNAGADITEQPFEWEHFLGSGVLPEASKADAETKGTARGRNQFYVNPARFQSPEGLQWLPAEFYVNPDGTECKVRSYINSLHPRQDQDLYQSISALFLQALPLLEDTLTESKGNKEEPRPKRVEADELGTLWSADDYESEGWEYHNTTICPPLIGAFEPPPARANTGQVSLRARPLQVIVKIASLELGPGETYEGGTWHVEGALDERIVATACCYLESTNIQGGDLAFRVAVQAPPHAQFHYQSRGVELVFGLGDGQPLVQNIGHCSTPQGRILAWPNTLQHRVGAINLADPALPGKRTICCFFLVDPTLRIRSTATVPPQQLSWIGDEAVCPLLNQSGVTDTNIHSKTLDYLSAMPNNGLLTYQQACERRDRLMAERRKIQDVGGQLFEREFSLCEH